MPERTDQGLAWQVGVWDQMADVYQREIDRRFAGVTDQLLSRANLRPGETVLDLGTGTGSVAIAASPLIGPTGRIIGVDISPEMLDKARARTATLSLVNVEFMDGRAEAIPSSDNSLDAVLASLSLMYVINRGAAAREIARVLRPGGRFVASVWAGPEEADIVQFQQTAGSFAPTPPVQGVGPGALADLGEFMMQLAAAGLESGCEQEVTGFRFADFDAAWDALAGVTTAALEPATLRQAKVAVQDRMWPDPNAAREFRNTTQYIVAAKPA